MPSQTWICLRYMPARICQWDMSKSFPRGLDCADLTPHSPGAIARGWGEEMDFGIAGKAALVCAASKGLGKGCALNLAREGVVLTIVARGREALEATAAEIRSATGATVSAVAADITTPEGRKAALAACPAPDILVNNAGGPPPGDFREWDREAWLKALDANMLTPIELIKATVDGMIARRWG